MPSTLLRSRMHKFYVELAAGVVATHLAFASTPGGGQTPLNSPPAWARDAVWYQIFPERFRNGDHSNDPTLNDVAAAWPHETPSQWSISSWTGDWYKLQPWESADGKGFYFRVHQRRYGGDLQGVLDKLDYIADLGINAIYFNPLFESPSLHKYDATMYHHIDNNFGPDPEGDRRVWATENPADPATWKWTSADRLFLTLIGEAHRRNIKIIIDGVFNHVGTTFWAFKDLREKGKQSAYKDWFTVTAWDDSSTPADEFDYKGWSGFKDLPEFRKDARGLARGPRDHIRAIVQRWMDPDGNGDPSDGIDGWRLDVAEKVPISFWREFRRWVRGVNPDAYIAGEVWWEDWGRGKMFNAGPWLRGDAFDAVMNYRLAREVCHFFKDDKNRITASEFDRRLARIRRDYRPEATAVLMNLLDSHDTDRIGSMIVNVDNEYDKGAGASDNPSYDVRKPDGDQLRIQKLMVLFQMTYIGAPMVYYGDEAGMWGGDDPDERKPMLWADMTYDGERSHPFGKDRHADVNAFNPDLFSYYKSVIALRRSVPALARGSYATLKTDDSSDVYAFLRSTKNTRVAIALNNSKEQQSVTLPVLAPERKGSWRVLFPATETPQTVSGRTLGIPPKSGIVLASESR
jgi:cyclomaltodextrinase